MKLINEMVTDSMKLLVRQDAVSLQYLIDVTVKNPGEICSLVYWNMQVPSEKAILDLCQSRGIRSPRPFRLEKPFSGSIGVPVLYLFTQYCAARNVDPVELMVAAYPEESDQWSNERFSQIGAEACWEGVVTPQQWDTAEVDVLVSALRVMNCFSLATVIELREVVWRKAIVAQIPEICF